MADVRLGGAYIEVGYDFKKASADAAAFGAKSIPIQKNVVAYEKQHTAAVKATSAAIDEQTRRIQEFLGVQNAAQRTTATNFVGGQKAGNVKAMMGAQLTYALQDLLTGASMGNMNQALLGMSNNLSMIAMLWGGMAGTITSVAVAALPLFYTGLKALVSETGKENELLEAQKRRVDALTDSYNKLLMVVDVLGKVRRAGAIDVTEMKEAGPAAHQVRNIEQDIKEAQAQRDVFLEKARTKGLEAAPTNVGPGVGVPAGLRPQIQAADKDFADQIAKRKITLKAITDNFAKQMERGFGDVGDIMKVAIGERPMHQIGKNRQVVKEGDQLLLQEIKDKDEVNKIEKQKQELLDKANEAEGESIALTKQLSIITERRNELLRRDLGFMQRTANAGFNNYERAKIELERKQAQERQDLRDKGFDKVPLGPRATTEELFAKGQQIDKEAQDAQDALVKEKQDQLEKNMVHGRRLSKKELADFDEREKQIEEERKKKKAALTEEGIEGPGTLLDPAMKALKTEQARERALLAQKFAGQAPGHFVSMEGLGKDVQSRIGGEKGLDFAQQTAGNTKSIAEAQMDLIQAVKDLNVGFGP